MLFKPPATAKSAAICSLPCGGGLGRGHSPSCGNLSQHPNRPNTSLAACYPLSNSLPRGERTGWLLGLRIPQGKRVCSLLFLLFRRPFKRPIQATCILLFSKYNQNQPSATVQAAFPILATRAASRSPHVGCVRYARTRSPFSLQPQPTACVPCDTHPTDGFKGRLKKRSRRLFHLPCDKGYLKNSRR